MSYQPHPDEVQIEACGAMPMVEGRKDIVARVIWYKIDPFKVTICYDDAEFHEKIEEFPLDKVKLSCFPWGYSKKKKDDAAICHVMEEITPCK